MFREFNYFRGNKARVVGRFKDFWNTGRDGKDAEKGSFIRYAIVITAFFILFVGFLSPNSVVRWVRTGFQIRAQEKQIESYETEIREMNDQIHGLTTSKDSLERYARENFHFVEPGDDVYVFDEGK